MEEIKSFIDKRPTAISVYGYGSGIFKQSGYNTNSHPQKDLIFVVENIKDWHLINMAINPTDYSLIGKVHLSHSSVSSIKGMNKITYHSNIQQGEDTFKYGVIEEKDLLMNLKTWDSLFVPGRFQKPTKPIITNPRIIEAIDYNKECAFRVACILSNETVSFRELLVKLCSLSYLGDIRMKIAENPRKVENIVDGSYEFLKDMYLTSRNYISIDGDMISIDHRLLLKEIEFLPEDLVEYLADYDTDLSNLDMVRENIIYYYKNKNFKESIYQTLKGVKTNGLVKSVPYVLAKVKKKHEKK